jgi:hypothetical protein
MDHDTESSEPGWWRIGKYLGFALVMATFAFAGERAGARAAGVLVIAQAYILLSAKRLPYGWEGREPTGYITGPLIQVLAVLLGGLGAAFVAKPTLMLGLLGFGE